MEVLGSLQKVEVIASRWQSLGRSDPTELAVGAASRSQSANVGEKEVGSNPSAYYVSPKIVAHQYRCDQMRIEIEIPDQDQDSVYAQVEELRKRLIGPAKKSSVRWRIGFLNSIWF